VRLATHTYPFTPHKIHRGGGMEATLNLLATWCARGCVSLLTHTPQSSVSSAEEAGTGRETAPELAAATALSLRVRAPTAAVATARVAGVVVVEAEARLASASSAAGQGTGRETARELAAQAEAQAEVEEATAVGRTPEAERRGGVAGRRID
jgi:hypothetical protein